MLHHVLTITASLAILTTTLFAIALFAKALTAVFAPTKARADDDLTEEVLAQITLHEAVQVLLKELKAKHALRASRLPTAPPTATPL